MLSKPRQGSHTCAGAAKESCFQEPVVCNMLSEARRSSRKARVVGEIAGGRRREEKKTLGQPSAPWKPISKRKKSNLYLKIYFHNIYYILGQINYRRLEFSGDPPLCLLNTWKGGSLKIELSVRF